MVLPCSGEQCGVRRQLPQYLRLTGRHPDHLFGLDGERAAYLVFEPVHTLIWQASSRQAASVMAASFPPCGEGVGGHLSNREAGMSNGMRFLSSKSLYMRRTSGSSSGYAINESCAMSARPGVSSSNPLLP